MLPPGKVNSLCLRHQPSVLRGVLLMSDLLTAAMNRRRLMQVAAATFGAAAIAPALGSVRVSAQDDTWSAALDPTKAKDQASEIITYGIPDDWANYGEVFKSFQTKLGVTGGKDTDTDMSSLEEI